VNKPLVLFIIGVVVLVIVKKVYCELKPDRCKNEEVDHSIGLPIEGQDW
jgi:hypothetical protein